MMQKSNKWFVVAANLSEGIIGVCFINFDIFEVNKLRLFFRKNALVLTVCYCVI